MLLNVDGHDVSIAKGGEKALAMFEAGEFDLVITGFDMPSMNGLEFAHAIRALSPRQPIVLLSSHIDPIQDKKVVLSNVNLVLEKPFSIAQLREAVARVFPAREGK
jgi:CheY-like chemotaxis protein